MKAYPRKPIRCRLGWHGKYGVEKANTLVAWWVCRRCGTPEPPPRLVVPAAIADTIAALEKGKR